MPKGFKMEIDPLFTENFRNLKQVFLYLIDECNLKCTYCLYKPNLSFHLKNRQIDIRTTMNLISDFKTLGAAKLTIMGGEPTLYGASNKHEPLLKLISYAKDIGFEYVRIDTNGMFDPALLFNRDFMKLDEITFSLDGPTCEINDAVRGKGSFDKCVSNIKTAVDLNYEVDVTSCVHKLNIGEKDNCHIIDSLVRYLTSIGVSRINFHPIFKMGVPRDTWISDVDIEPEQWMATRKALAEKVLEGSYKIPLRIPQRFISKEEFEKDPEYYGYCSAKMGERVLVHPNGIIRICALLIGTPFGVAKFYDEKIVWDKSITNELNKHSLSLCTPCANQTKCPSSLVPLCISFKAEQKEFVWSEKLKWDNKKLSHSEKH